MGYVYAVRFGTNKIKFGRTGNPYRRIKAYNDDAMMYGFRITSAIYAYTDDDIASEKELLRIARVEYESIGREMFLVEDINDAIEIFEQMNLSPLVCRVRHKPYRIVVEGDCFDRPLRDRSETTSDNLGDASDVDYRTKRRIAQVIRQAGGSPRLNHIHSKVTNKSNTFIDACVKEMIISGAIVKNERGYPEWQSLHEYSLTPFGNDLYPV